MSKTILLLLFLTSCATALGPLPPERRGPAAKSSNLLSSCMLHIRQLFETQQLVTKGEDLVWRQEKIVNNAAAIKLYQQIGEDPFYPALHPRFDDLFWAYLFSLPPEFQWLLQIAIREDALALLQQLNAHFMSDPSSITGSILDWVFSLPNHLQRQQIWQEKHQWWQHLEHNAKFQLRTALKEKINDERITHFWNKYYYVPINVEKKSDHLVNVTMGSHTYPGKIEDNALFLTVPSSLVKIRDDNPLNHLKETMARTKGPRDYYIGSLDLDGKITLADGNHTFYIYSRTAPAVVIRLAFPLQTINLRACFIQNYFSGPSPSLEQIALLVRGKLTIFDLLPPAIRDNTPWQEADFLIPPFPFVDLFE